MYTVLSKPDRLVTTEDSLAAEVADYLKVGRNKRILPLLVCGGLRSYELPDCSNYSTGFVNITAGCILWPTCIFSSHFLFES